MANTMNATAGGVGNRDEDGVMDIGGVMVAKKPGGGCSTCIKRSDSQASHGKPWVQSPWLCSGFILTLYSLDLPEPTFPRRKSIKLSIPDVWKQWMFTKAMKTDAPCSSEAFRKVFTDYLHGLPASTHKIRGTVMDQAWSHLGWTGIIGLVLCLYWQVVYSGLERLACKF